MRTKETDTHENTIGNDLMTFSAELIVTSSLVEIFQPS